MKAWQLDHLGGTLRANELPLPEVRPGSVLIRLEACGLLSYQKAYVAGALPHYSPPDRLFTIGSNGVGTIHEIGRDVIQLAPGQRVVISPYVVTDERVAEPAQMLLGLTGYGAPAKRLQAEWPDGTLAEYVLAPKSCVTPVPLALSKVDPAQLATAARFVVPYGGLLRGRLAAGEIVVVNGATGAFGTAATLLALALGAGRVVAAGRQRAALDGLARDRVVPVVLTGDVAKDSDAMRAAAGGAADLAFDMIGRAADPNATLAALRSLRRQGRLVLMGSMNVPLPLPYGDVMFNDWEIIGQFMYPPDAYRRLLGLVATGQLDLRAIRPHTFTFDEMPAALDAAAAASSVECVVVLLG